MLGRDGSNARRALIFFGHYCAPFFSASSGTVGNDNEDNEVCTSIAEGGDMSPVMTCRSPWVSLPYSKIVSVIFDNI